jgi:hypothetical protein
MRAVLTLVLSLSTSCAALLSEPPGPRCTETSTVVLDLAGGFATAVVALMGWAAIGGCVVESGPVE